MTRARRYVCPACGTAMKDLDAVRRRLEAKKDFITCQKCDEQVRQARSASRFVQQYPMNGQAIAIQHVDMREGKLQLNGP